MGHCTRAATVPGIVELSTGGALLVFGVIAVIVGATSSPSSGSRAYFDLRSLTLHF